MNCVGGGVLCIVMSQYNACKATETKGQISICWFAEAEIVLNWYGLACDSFVIIEIKHSGSCRLACLICIWAIIN